VRFGIASAITLNQGKWNDTNVSKPSRYVADPLLQLEMCPTEIEG
jgi:hypothetical protein